MLYRKLPEKKDTEGKFSKVNLPSINFYKDHEEIFCDIVMNPQKYRKEEK